MPWPSVGGTEVATLRIARAVEGKGLTSVAFVPRGGTAVRALFESHGVPVTEYDPPEPSYRHMLAYGRRSLALARQLRLAAVDLVHCADVLAAFRCGLGAMLGGVPVITHVRGRLPHVSRRDATFYWPIRRFVFVSREARASFGLRLPARRACVLYDGIDLPSDVPAAGVAVRAELGIASDARVVGMVARVAPAKDYPTLVAAAALVVAAYPDAVFLIVGQRSGVREYAEHYGVVSKLIAEVGLTSHFLFTDHRSDVDRLIQAMDVCVLATFAEGLPLVILEAMAHGKPVVATSVGGIPEIVRDGETGVLVPLRDSRALAQAVVALLDDPARAASLGAAGRAEVQGEFSSTAFERRLRLLYDDVLDDTRQAGAHAPDLE
jgi:glycosyltransferase involved in cell wall biosynthesis